MKYRYFGQTGVKISQYGFGTMSFGDIADEKMSKAMFHRCREAGINFFDCANVYGGGRSEEILGECIRDCREEVVITSKVYFPTGDDVNARGASRKHIRAAVESSLRRLNTGYIDVYYIHRFDEMTALEDTLRTLDELVSEGKILYPAVSNFAAWQVEKALGIAAKEGFARVECIQPMYNLVKRQAEVEILPMAGAENLAVTPYSPLGGGLLTGKYGENKRPDTGRLMENKMYEVRYGADWNYKVAGQFTGFAREHGHSPVPLALAWVESHPAVTAPLIGARNLDQLSEALEAVDIEISPEMREEISALSPSPSPATDRNEERTKHNYGTR